MTGDEVVLEGLDPENFDSLLERVIAAVELYEKRHAHPTRDVTQPLSEKARCAMGASAERRAMRAGQEMASER